ncbi:hypothetical protein [Halobellus limi]|uniref:DUF1102 domain-containing protein n=1 Tax=Halobellus limi TaxID=699433 RepID=A0A1H5TT73_9EURY|nr:hypothetical protein [Halobellus limi]QCC47249.1 hypothetical protein DV707_05950 [Halobellus limi]SEF65408.1 hypothetical protein SAMN04488133_0359 [Halobellus limi]
MALSRRNVLIGLGALVGGGGALVGTGAFTTVSAERSVEVSTAGDASAFLSITGDGDYVEDNSGDDGTLTINIGGPDGSGLNEEAITTIDGIVTITNNAADTDASTTVGVSTDGPESAEPGDSASVLVPSEGDNSAAVVTFYVGETGSNSVGDGSTQDLDEGESAELDVEIDTRQATVDDTDAEDTGLTIVAGEN